MDTTFMPVPACNMRIGRMQFYHPDQEKARQFANHPKQEGLMSMLILGIVLSLLGAFWVSYRLFSTPAPPRQGQLPRQRGLFSKVLPYLVLAGGAVMTMTAIPLMHTPYKVLTDPALSRDCVETGLKK